MKRRLLVMTALVCVATLAQTQVAYAALPTVYVYGRNGGGEVRASATYNDDTNKFCVQDRYADYHSGLVQYKRQSTSGWGTAFEVWDHSTADGVAACVFPNFADNTPLVMRVCVGEWSEDPARRVILKNSSGGPWCGTTRQFLS